MNHAIPTFITHVLKYENVRGWRILVWYFSFSYVAKQNLVWLIIFPALIFLSCEKLEDAETETLWERATKKLPPTSEIVKGRPGGRHHT